MSSGDTTGDETTVLPDTTVTEVRDGLAWSLDDTDEPDSTEPDEQGAPELQSWRTTWRNAGLLVLCAAVLAGVIGVGGLGVDRCFGVRGRGWPAGSG